MSRSAFDILYFIPMKLWRFLIVGCFLRINTEVTFKGFLHATWKVFDDALAFEEISIQKNK